MMTTGRYPIYAYRAKPHDIRRFLARSGSAFVQVQIIPDRTLRAVWFTAATVLQLRIQERVLICIFSSSCIVSGSMLSLFNRFIVEISVSKAKRNDHRCIVCSHISYYIL